MLRGRNLYPSVAEMWVDELGFLEPTRGNYLANLRRFHGRLQEHRPGARFSDITADDVRNFVEVANDGGRRADRTRRHLLGLIWQLCDWATDPEVGLLQSNPASKLRALYRRERRAPTDVNRRTWLSAERARVLLATTRGDGSLPIDRRDYTLIALYLYSGLRLTELPRVRWRDVDFAGGEHGVITVLRKGRKLTAVPLTPAARKVLFGWRAEFLEAVGPDIEGLAVIPQTRAVLVEGQVGKPGARRENQILWRRPLRSGPAIRTRIIIRARAAGIDHLRPHDLRRSLAGMLEDAGASLREIQAALGHAQLATTERYLETKPKLAKAAENLDLG
jgi:integrase